LQQKFNPEHVADRTGSALAEFPKASFDFIGIKIGEWKFRDMSEIDKVELRRRFDRQYALRNTKTTNDSLEYLNLEKVSADPSVYKIYFGIGQLVEPLDGQSIVFNCKEHVWGDLGPGGSPQCVVAYALDDETGISVYYKFYEDLMPKQTWVSLDQKMRRFFVDMISDPKIKSRLEKAAISP
jgi:hypothetical protein